MSDKIEKAIALCKEIYECPECDFLSEVRNLGSIYRPDYPPIMNSEYKTMVIGINPGWREKNSDDWNSQEQRYRWSFERYNEWKLEQSAQSKVPMYFHRIANDVNVASKKLKILKGEIAPNMICKYALWCNLSFCASPNIGNRVLGNGLEVGCNIESERSNCLQKKFVLRFVEIFLPELVIFTSGFDRSAKLLPQLGIEMRSEPKLFVFEANAKKNYRVHAVRGRIKALKDHRSVSILFVPHPRSRQFTKDGFKAYENALGKACDFLKPR